MSGDLPFDPNDTRGDTNESEAEGTPADETSSPQGRDETILIDGKEYPAEEVLRWKDEGEIKATLTRKTQQFSKERNELQDRIDAQNAKITELEAAMERGREGNPEMDDDPLSVIQRELREIKGAQEATRNESRAFLESERAREALESALGEYEGVPFANTSEMREFLQERHLGPEHTDVAYHALYGHLRGAASKEAQLRRRNATAPAPMGKPTVGLPQSQATDVPTSTKSLRDTSFQELRDRAQADPRWRAFDSE